VALNSAAVQQAGSRSHDAGFGISHPFQPDRDPTYLPRGNADCTFSSAIGENSRQNTTQRSIEE